MIERLNMDDKFSQLEATIHLNRYLISKKYCKDKKVLDLACGEGYGTYLISKWGAKEVVGIDISSDAINSATKNFKNDGLSYLEADATNLEKIKDNSFDMVVSYETFEHVNNVDKYLDEIKRVSKKNAVIIISCPNDYYYYPSDSEHNPFHTKKYTFNDFKSIAEKHLGKNVNYLLGMEVAGYINTNSKVLDSNNAKNRNIIDCFYNVECNKIVGSQVPNPEFCNYYIGIWNASEIEESCCVFPHMYTDWKEAIDSLENDNDILKQYNGELEKSIVIHDKANSELKQYNIDLENSIKKLDLDNHELNRNNQSLEESNKILNKNIDELEKENSKLKLEVEKNIQANSIIMYQKEEVSNYARGLYDNYEQLKKELNETQEKLNEANKRVFDLQDKNETLKMQMGYITNSRSYKITRKLVKLVKRK